MKTDVQTFEHLRIKRSFVFGAALAVLALGSSLFLNQPGIAAQPVPCTPTSAEVHSRLAHVLQEVRDNTRLPEKFTPEIKAELVHEFVKDGRPILVVTDAHYGQKSGVVTVMDVMKQQVEKLTDGKVTIKYITPDMFSHIHVKELQDLKIAPQMSQKDFEKILAQTNPQAVHIMVEGGLGKRARKYLIAHDIPFTTAYHSNFPEFARDLVLQKTHSKILGNVTEWIVHNDVKKFHKPSAGVLVPTKTTMEHLQAGGFRADNLRPWSHGVDTELFNPSKADPKLFAGLPRPISLFVGRVAPEKNIQAFLDMKIPGTKVVVGDGPDLEMLKAKYPNVVFAGRKDYAKEIPVYAASSDVFVFPSLTDTFGLVQLEANAAGTPVAAYKVQGPIDVITSPKSGVLAPYDAKAGAQNVRALEQAWQQAVKLDRKGAREFAEENTWEKSTLEFMWYLSKLPKPEAAEAATKVKP